MKQIVVFQEFADESPNMVYSNVAEEATQWLAEHPGAQIIASHTNLYATENATEFAITLIVELPGQSAQ